MEVTRAGTSRSGWPSWSAGWGRHSTEATAESGGSVDRKSQSNRMSRSGSDPFPLTGAEAKEVNLVRPHPGPLPRGREDGIQRGQEIVALDVGRPRPVSATRTRGGSSGVPARFPLLGACHYRQVRLSASVNPKGILEQSPGLRGTSNPGNRGPNVGQPQRGCGPRCRPGHKPANW